MRRLKKFGSRYGLKKFAEGGEMKKSPDEEADIGALKVLQQGDYDVGGPKRRYRPGKAKRFSGGGSASKRADGIAKKGKTRGKFV